MEKIIAQTSSSKVAEPGLRIKEVRLMDDTHIAALLDVDMGAAQGQIELQFSLPVADEPLQIEHAVWAKRPVDDGQPEALQFVMEHVAETAPILGEFCDEYFARLEAAE